MASSTIEAAQIWHSEGFRRDAKLESLNNLYGVVINLYYEFKPVVFFLILSLSPT